MSSTADSERPPAVSEKPLLDHITTDSPEDSHTDSENPAKLKNAKNIGTTTPEVEGEDNEPVAAVEDYPSTPVSTMDSSFQALPLTEERKEDSAPLPPTPEETEFSVSKEAEITSLPPPTEAEEKQLDDAEEPKVEVKENSDKAEDKTDSKPAGVTEVVRADEKIAVPESSEKNQGPSEEKVPDLKTEEKSLESPVEKVEEESTPEEEEPATISETPTALDASDHKTEVLRAAEPVEEDDDQPKDTPVAEVAEDVTENPVKGSKDEIKDESKRDPEALEEESIEESKEEAEPETTKPTEAEPPTIAVLPLTEPPKEEVTISSNVGEDTSDSKPAEESAEDAQEETKPVTDDLVGAEPQAVEVLPLTEPSKEEDDSPSVEADTKVESEPTEEFKEDTKVETKPEAEQEAEPEAAEISEPVEVEPAVPDVLPLTEAPKEEETPSIDVDAIPQSETAEEPKENETEEVLKAEQPTEALAEAAEETSEVPKSQKEAETPIATEAPPDDGPSQELKEAVAAEPEVPAVPEPSTEPEEPKEPESAPEFTEQSVEKVKEADSKSDIPQDNEQETQEVVQATPILDEVKPEGSEHKPADAESPPAVEDAEEVVPVEIQETNDAPIVPKTVVEEGISANAGPEESTGEGQEATEFEPEEVVTETSVGDDKPSDLAETPTVIVEKTIENQPSHGEDLGSDATEGQKEAFEKRKTDAELDEVIVTEEPPTPHIVPAEESISESTPAASEVGAKTKASSELTNEITAEPASNPAALEKEEDLARDEPVVISHGDAPPAEVEKAEGAVGYPSPDLQEVAAETLKEVEAENDGKPPVSTEQEHEEEPFSVEEPVAIAAVVAEIDDDAKDLSEEISTDPVPLSDSPSNPVSAPEGDKAPAVETEPEATEKVTEATAESSTVDESQIIEKPAEVAIEQVAPEVAKEDISEESTVEEPEVVVPTEMNDKVAEPASSKETEPEETVKVTEAAAEPTPLEEPQAIEEPTDIAPEPAFTPEVAKAEISEEPNVDEPEVAAATEMNGEVEEPASPKEPEETPATQEIAHPAEPVEEAPKESVADSSVGSDIQLDQDSHEGVVTANLMTPEDIQPAIKEEASTEVPEEELGFSVSPLPASQTIGNPIDLAPGEKIPEEFKVSVEDTVQVEDSPEPASGKLSEILPPVTDDKPTVQPESSVESQPEEQMFSVNPFPDSKTFGNPIDLQPGEPIPAYYLTQAFVADSVILDGEAFKKPSDKAPLAEEAKAEESDDDTGKKILAAGVGAGLVGLGTYAAVKSFDDKKTEAGKHSSEKVSLVAAPAVDPSAKSTSSPAQEQVLPVEVSSTTPVISKELREPPLVPKTDIGPTHPVDKSTQEIIEPVGTEVLDKKPLQASATNVPDKAMVSQSVGKSMPDNGDEVIAEPAPQNAPSAVHGVMVPDELVTKVMKDAETSETPAIVVSGPPNPITGSGTSEVIQPSSSEVAFDEASANKARESGEIFAHPVWNESVSPLLQYSLENTPEGVRKRRVPGSGGELSRPTSSGTDNISSTRHHRNIMNGFWHVVLFGWLGGFGRFFGGMFSKSKSRKQRR
ncbi:hypothetical protein L873DRAFT_1793828 [Choiromyces venosus 120613-1]|uniref:Uncharacterized protein n=1 Tax=Choiromyces venosus 120613-1 TaxID=1336337 RepID=A0A3N4JH61_9PEZI|nr:hypothetical protein L873DRAFT_1793828 [Choiromyces venosus 120613-1]